MKMKQPLIPPPPPHVLIFPLPLQGPINCNLKLAELLCISGIHVTFLNTDHIHRQLLLHTDVHSRFSRYPHFSFQTVPDGLSKDHPRSIDCFDELIQGIEAVTNPIFREIVSSGGRSSGRPVTCIIADGIFDFAVDVAVENRISIFYFETLSPCCVWAYLCISKLIEDGQLPFKGNDLDAPISCVPGSEVLIRQRDLPGLYRNYNPAKPSIEFELALNQGKQLKRAQGLILNTFEELERPILSQLRSICPNTYAIGPLHAHFKTRLVLQTKSPMSNSSNSLWEEEKHCIDWLDKQPTKSVIYINMGSLVVTTMDQLIEFWHGLVNSGKRFLWVRRPGSIIGYEDTYVIPEELSNGTKERGCIVSWVAQEEVLAHSAIGAFLTHSGWNSTLESIIEGVPMICWPHHADQQVNSRFVSEVWKLGMDMKDTCDRVVIEKMVMDIMGVKFENEIMQSVDMTAKLGKESIAKEVLLITI